MAFSWSSIRKKGAPIGFTICRDARKDYPNEVVVWRTASCGDFVSDIAARCHKYYGWAYKDGVKIDGILVGVGCSRGQLTYSEDFRRKACLRILPYQRVALEAKS